MRILWVKSGGLVPLDHGGKIRSFHLAKELASRHEVDLFTFYSEFPEDDHSSLVGLFPNVYAIPLKIPAAHSRNEYVNYARNLFSTKPYSVSKYCQPVVSSRLKELLDREKYDLLICDFLLTSAVVPWDKPMPKVLFTHNIEAMIWERHYKVSRNPIWKAVSYREYRMMERFEQRCLRKAQHVLAVSEFDRDFFAKSIDKGRLSVVPTGVDIDYFQPSGDDGGQNSLVFTGSMDWMPNEDGIVWFVEEILPRIRAKVPDVSLQVVGRRPTTRLKNLAREYAGITVTGRVEDIRPYMNSGRVFIVPLRVGGGTRLKIFEAMAAGKPIVSTTVGAEGLPVTNRKDIHIADEADNFAGSVIELLQSSDMRQALGCSARKLVEDAYSWRSVAASLDDTLRKVAIEFAASEG